MHTNFILNKNIIQPSCYLYFIILYYIYYPYFISYKNNILYIIRNSYVIYIFVLNKHNIQYIIGNYYNL